MANHPCEVCHTPYNPDLTHTEVHCLKSQIERLKVDRNAWKEAWWKQREATGNAAWEYLNKGDQR
jgi:hypothetical protein